MLVSKVFSRVSRHAFNQSRFFTASIPRHNLLSNNTKWTPCLGTQLSDQLRGTFARFGFSSTASPQTNEKMNQSADEQGSSLKNESTAQNVPQGENENNSVKESGDSKAFAKKEESGSSLDPKMSESVSSNKRRRHGPKRTAFSDSDEESDLSMKDLVELVAEKEVLLKEKEEEVKRMQDKVLRAYADMENVIHRTKRESENTKKFAIQNFAKSLLDVADNLGRASSVVKESFSKIDHSQDSAGAVPLLKTLLEGVEMTEKQLAEVFRKFGVEKFDPLDEQFDPNRHLAVFQVPDPSKTPGTIAAVLKCGYVLDERVIRPAEVGVVQEANQYDDPNSDA